MGPQPAGHARFVLHECATLRVRLHLQPAEQIKRSSMHRVIPYMRTLAGIAALAVVAISSHGQVALAQDAAGSKVVATVDGKQITESDMKIAEGEIGSELANLPPEVRRRALAEYLIDN